MSSPAAPPGELYARLEAGGLLGLVLRREDNVSSCLYLHLLCSPILLALVFVSLLLTVLLGWEEVAAPLSASTSTSTSTTTTNPATVVEARIHDPNFGGLCAVLTGTLAACVLGGLLSVLLWASERCLRGSCRRSGQTTVERQPQASSADPSTVKPQPQASAEPLLLSGTVGTPASFPELQVHLQFLQAAKASPAAQVLTSGNTALTYAELQDKTASAAHALQDAGVCSCVLVALHLQSGVLTIVSILGTWIAGGAWVPIDWEAPAQRLELLMDDVQPRVVVSQRPAAFNSAAASVSLLVADEAVMSLQRFSATASESSGSLGTTGLAQPGLAQIIYTSGSTGSPKGVMYSHQRISFACHFFASQCGIKAGVRVLQKTPYIWAVFRHEVFPAICHSGQLVVAAPHERKDPRRLASLIQSQGVEVLVATPSIMELVVEAGGMLPSLRTAVCMGEGVRVEVAQRILERAGGALKLYNFYGSTESENVVYPVPRLGAEAWKGLTGRYLPAGWPQPNISLHVLDPETLAARATGLEGEICFGGILSDGYWGKPELTQERFLNHPTLGRLYRTGDVGVWDRACGLRVVGRTDRQVKIRGIRVELEEVEALLLQAVRAAGGSEAAAVAAPAPGSSGVSVSVDGRQSDGEHLTLVAFAAAAQPQPQIQPQPQPQLEGFNASSIRRECEARMPPYMVPSVIQTLDALPRLPNQKVDLKRLSVLADTAKETVQALDSLGMLRVLSRAQLEEDVWLQNMQAFWMLAVMLGHFQLNGGAASSHGIDCGNQAWRLEMMLGHGKDMVAFMLMVGFTDSRDPITFGLRDLMIIVLALLMSGPLQYVLSPGYGPLTAIFSPPLGGINIGHGWFLYSLVFARVVLNLLHLSGLRPVVQVLLSLAAAMLLPDDVWDAVPSSWRTWLWWSDAGVRYKGFRWSCLFMSACYQMGFHLGAAVVRSARRWAPSSHWRAAVLVGACWSGFLAMSLLNAPSPVLAEGYSTFQAVYNEELSSHLVTWHYMTHPSLPAYVLLWLGEFVLFLLPPLFVAVAMAYCPVHFKTMGTTSLGNYVLHPTYIGAPWTSVVQAPVLSRITSPALGPVPNILITFLWNVVFCIVFAMTLSAAFHRGLIALFGALGKALRKTWSVCSLKMINQDVV